MNNSVIRLENKRKKRNILIGAIVIILGISLWILGYYLDSKALLAKDDLHNLIISSDTTNQRIDKYASIEINYIPYKFAGYSDTQDSYYIVVDSKYLYIAYMSEEDFEKLNRDDLLQNPIQVTGVTKSIPSDVKELALEAYNEVNVDNPMVSSDFELYFGDVYLDMTDQFSDSGNILYILGFLIVIFGLIILIISLINYLKYKKNIKKLTAEEQEELEREMNDSEAFYYQTTKLYLTKNYIINFDGTFKALKYQDILWMYPYIYRYNGVKTLEAIKVLDNQGKTYTIAKIESFTKKQKEVYNEIWQTIISKNNKIITGYTKENIEMMKEKIKEIKN